MRIAVTGATGFVGRALLPRLLAEGHAVTALVRDIASAKLPSGVDIVRGELADEHALTTLCAQADGVVHIAGCIAALRRADFFRINVDGSINVLRAAQRAGVKRFVHVSSLAARRPLLADYGASKQAAEAALQDMAGDVQLTILRPAAVYGPGDKATLPLLKALMSRTAFIPGSAAGRFAMVHVDDVARCLLQAAMSPRHGIFAVDDGVGGHDWPELVSITRAAFGLPLRHYFIPCWLATLAGQAGDLVGRLKGRPWLVTSGQIKQIYYPDWTVQETRWTLQNPVSLQQGLPDTIGWYQAQGLLPQAARRNTRPVQKDEAA